MTDSDTQAPTGLATYHDPSHNAAALILDPRHHEVDERPRTDDVEGRDNSPQASEGQSS